MGASKRTLLPLALSAMATAVAACGGGERPAAAERPADRQTPAQDARAAYVKRADAICNAAVTRERRALAATDGDSVPGLRRSVRIGQAALAELRALDAPGGDEAEVEELLSAFERMVDARAEMLRAQRTASGPGWTRAENAFFTAYQDLAATAGPYGIDWCQGFGFD